MEQEQTENKEQFSRNLRCPLSETEIVERAQIAARLLQTRDELEAELKAETKRRKAFIEEKDAEHRRIAAEIRDKATFREVDCERIFDYRLGCVTEARTDTGEILNSRPMTYSERQLGLSFDDAEAPTLTDPAPPPVDDDEPTDEEPSFEIDDESPISEDNPDPDHQSSEFDAMLDRCDGKAPPLAPENTGKRKKKTTKKNTKKK